MNYSDKLLQKLEHELKDFKEYVKEHGIDFAIDKAYELTIKQEIIDSIIYDRTLSEKEIEILLKCDNVLDQCYDEWLKSDGNIRDTLNFVVDERVDFIIDDYSKDDEKTKFDYSISDKTEEIPVGHIKYNDHEVIMYFSEKELLRDYKDEVNNSGINSVQVHINKNKDKPRHGLSYSITEEQYNQYGAEYSKEQYEKNYNKSQIKKKNKEVR